MPCLGVGVDLKKKVRCERNAVKTKYTDDAPRVNHQTAQSHQVDHTPDTKVNEDVRQGQVDLPQALTIATTCYTDSGMLFLEFWSKACLAT